MRTFTSLIVAGAIAALPVQTFAATDAKTDKGKSVAELIEKATARIKAQDLNHDGYISREERAQAKHQRMAAKHEKKMQRMQDKASPAAGK